MRTTGLTILTIALMSVVVVVVFYEWSSGNRAAGHQVARTRTDLRIISQALKTVAITQPATITRPSISNLNACSLYQLLSRTNSGVRVLEPRHDWDLSGAILDRWGRPFRVSAAFSPSKSNDPSRATSATVKIWSVGPNGKDEGGGGDDMVENTEVDLGN